MSSSRDSENHTESSPLHAPASFHAQRVMVTGGLGFLGSNLARELLAQGADVLVVDAWLDGCGANVFNLQGIEDDLRFDVTDIRDQHAMRHLVRGVDYVFHMAGQVSHVQGLEDPAPDLDINVRGTLVLLEAIRKANPGARLIAASTRSVYAPEAELPVKETAPTRPTGPYEWSKLSAEHLVSLYHELHGQDAIILRFSNIYGPRGQVARPGAGIANWFCRRALQDLPLRVFGDGGLSRDFLYVDDAVEAVLSLAHCKEAYGEVFNLGHSQSSSLLELARLTTEIADAGTVELEPFPREWAIQSPRDFLPDLSKLQSFLPWNPTTPLQSGLEKTLSFYREFGHHYWS